VLQWATLTEIPISISWLRILATIQSAYCSGSLALLRTALGIMDQVYTRMFHALYDIRVEWGRGRVRTIASSCGYLWSSVRFILLPQPFHCVESPALSASGLRQKILSGHSHVTIAFISSIRCLL
jgi:hypothetical protein